MIVQVFNMPVQFDFGLEPCSAYFADLGMFPLVFLLFKKVLRWMFLLDMGF